MVKGKHKNISNRNQGNMAPSEHSSPTIISPNYLNTTQEQDSDLTFYLIKVSEGFKKDINGTLKDREKNTGKKQVEALRGNKYIL